MGDLGNVGTVVLEAPEERLPLRVDRRGIGQIARMQVLHIGSIAAIKE